MKRERNEEELKVSFSLIAFCQMKSKSINRNYNIRYELVLITIGGQQVAPPYTVATIKKSMAFLLTGLRAPNAFLNAL